MEFVISLEEKQSIQYLELWQIRDLKDVDILSSLVGLQISFSSVSFHTLQPFHLWTRLSRLRRIVVENMSGLADFSNWSLLRH